MKCNSKSAIPELGPESPRATDTLAKEDPRRTNLCSPWVKVAVGNATVAGLLVRLIGAGGGTRRNWRGIVHVGYVSFVRIGRAVLDGPNCTVG